MSLVKYRLKEVAADFGVAPKVIADIISKYFQKPKSNTQVLTDEELNLVFDSMTQTHQIASLEQVFAVKPAPKAEPPKPEAPKAEAPKQEAQQAAKPQQAKPQSSPRIRTVPSSPPRPARSLPRQTSPRSLNGSGSAGWWTPPPCRSTPDDLPTWTIWSPRGAELSGRQAAHRRQEGSAGQ